MDQITQERGVSTLSMSQVFLRAASQAVCLLVAAVVFPVAAFAQIDLPIFETGCTKVRWAANTEPDLAGYRIFVSKDGYALPPVEIDETFTSLLCTDLPFVEGHAYGVQMTAFDESGNSSEPTPSVGFVWPDGTSPGAPVSVCIVAAVDGEPVEVCISIEPL